MISRTVDKTVRLRLVGLDGNCFNLLGAFAKAARRDGWTKAEIDAVLSEAMSGDYEHLLVTLARHCEEGGE